MESWTMEDTRWERIHSQHLVLAREEIFRQLSSELGQREMEVC